MPTTDQPDTQKTNTATTSENTPKREYTNERNLPTLHVTSTRQHANRRESQQHPKRK